MAIDDLGVRAISNESPQEMVAFKLFNSIFTVAILQQVKSISVPLNAKLRLKEAAVYGQ